MTLVIDNYDSFTFNLVQAIEGLGVETKVVRNDKIDVAGIAAMNPDRLVISPGPGNPDSAGVSLAAVKAFAGKIPILGVCLGHQTVAQAFGGRIVPAKSLMHGKTSRVRHDGKGIFADVPQGFEAMRYHSLAVERATLPDCLEVSAETDDGEIMALRHRTLPIETVQYHPESIGTPEGVFQLRNFFGLGEGSKSPAETVAYHEFRGILRGDYTERELSALLTLGREDAVSPDRLLGAARAMRDAMAKIDLGACSDAVDLVGTGGDGHPTINISTTAAFVAACAGVRIASRRDVEERRGGRAAGARRGPFASASAGARVVQQDGRRVPLRAALPRGNALRGERQEVPRVQDALQPARSAHQPGGSRAPRHRRVRSESRPGHRADAPAARMPPRARVLGRRRNGRDIASRRDARCRG